MSHEAWVTLGIAVFSGFGVWMFRIDRGLTKLNRLMNDVEKLDTRVDNHSQRIVVLETKAKLEPRT